MIAHLGCSTGISGDKLLGALLDAGSTDGAFSEEILARRLAEMAPEARVVVERVRSRGIAAVSVRVRATERSPHRTLADLEALLARAGLSEATRARASTVFGMLAQAEAKAHGCAVEDVHFHEVGALDSILDVVGVCLGIEALGIEHLTCSEVATGWGTVDTSHGTLPVPAPATALLLENIPTVPGPAGAEGAAPGELTTPTGAALARTLVSSFGPSRPMTPRVVGYGAGTRDIGHPNVCRITLGDAAEREQVLTAETVALLETNIDHISPEAAAVAAEQLLAEGALDVWTAPVTMKKGRAAFILSTLVAPESAERFAARVVELTGTLGVRQRELERFVAGRESKSVATQLGTVRVKIGADRSRIEADDVARLAAANGISFDAAQACLEEAVESDVTTSGTGV